MNEPLIDAEGFRHGYAQIGDVRLHYVESGAPSRAKDENNINDLLDTNDTDDASRTSEADDLVILLHGFPECWYSWRHQLHALAPKHHAVALDLRGYNASDKPPRVEDYRVDLIVQDVLGLISHFGAKRATIVGHDWGAIVAWAVASKYPQHVAKLVCLQVPPPKVWFENMSVRQALASWYMLFFQLPGVPEWILSRDDFAVLTWMLRGNARRGTFTDADIDVYKSAFRKPGALTAALNYYRANLRRLFQQNNKTQTAATEPVRVPTLFIYGERDAAILPQSVRNVANHVHATYRELRLPFAGHWVQQEYATEVNHALLDFLGAA